MFLQAMIVVKQLLSHLKSSLPTAMDLFVAD